MLKRLGQWVYQNKYKTLLIWLVVLVALIGTMMGIGTHYNSDLKISGVPSTNIQGTLEREFHQNPSAGTMKAVIKNHHGVDRSQIKRAVNHSIHRVDRQSGIKSVANPYASQIISKDHSTTYVNVTFKKDANAVSQSKIHAIERDFNNLKHTGSKIAFSGTVQVNPLAVGELPEIIGMIIAFVLLLILFRSFVAAGLPVISALVGLLSGIGLVGIGSRFLTINNFASTLTAMLSLAVGIDYALFILNRYKTDLKEFHGDQKSALGNAVSEAGKSVIFAGCTVIIAVCGLSLIKISFLTQMGFSAAVGVLFALFSALTLLPALITCAKRHIKPNAKDTATMVKHPNGFSRFLVNHSVIASVIALVILLVFAFPARNMRLGMPSDGSNPKYQTSRQAYDTLANKFGAGINSPLIDVIKLNPNVSKTVQRRQINRITSHVQKMKGAKTIVPMVNKPKAKRIEAQMAAQAKAKLASPQTQMALKAKLAPIVKAKTAQQLQKHPKLAKDPQAAQIVGNQVKAKVVQQFKQQAKAKVVKQVKAVVMAKAVSKVKKSHDGKYAIMTILPKRDSQSVETSNLANHLKSYGKYTQRHYHAKMTLTGINAINLDTVNKLNHAIPLFATIIIVIAFILLMIAFRSLLIPLVAMVGFGLSLLASFGLMTTVMQEGYFKGLFGISKGAPIVAFLPVIIIGILFGLAMDYEVFMVSRAREEYAKTHDNQRSILVAIQDSGPVVITAALIMISVFGSFGLNSNPTIKSIAFGLAFGVLCDAFLVRLIIVPAMIKLFGKANWWFPGHHNK